MEPEKDSNSSSNLWKEYTKIKKEDFKNSSPLTPSPIVFILFLFLFVIFILFRK